MEGNLLKRIQLALSKSNTVRVFRNNTGTAWQGKPEWQGNSKLILHNPRPLDAGLCVGSSDLIGWTSIEITPDMVGQKLAIFTAIEGKTGKGKATKEQANFLRAVVAAGGRAGIANDVPDAVQIVTTDKSGI